MQYTDSLISIQIKEDILWAEFNNCKLNLETAKNVVKKRLRFQKGNTFPAIIDLNGLKDISLEARLFLAREGSRGFEVAAFILPPSFPTGIANLLLYLNKSKIPTKTFRNYVEAEEWIWSERNQVLPAL